MELSRSGWNCACPSLPILPIGAQSMSPQAPYSQTQEALERQARKVAGILKIRF